MNAVSESYLKICASIEQEALRLGRNPKEIKLIAVTKSHPLRHVLPAYEAGCRDFGENRVQEALEKKEEAPGDLRWHLIGTLQKNKVNKAVGNFSLIHSVDTPELAEKISAAGKRDGVVTSILLQVNTSGEKSKHGLPPDEWRKRAQRVLELEHIRWQGLMTIAPFTEDSGEIRRSFAALRALRGELSEEHGLPLPELSMGMTHDWRVALEEGATLLRIGTAIFGKR